MTGPEHYRAAELCVELAGGASDKGDSENAMGFLAAAQVHATLSLAAATALGREGENRTMTSKDRAAWFDAAAECRKEAA